MLKPSTFTDQPRGVLKLPQINDTLDPGGREVIGIAYSYAFIENVFWKRRPGKRLDYAVARKCWLKILLEVVYETRNVYSAFRFP